VNLRIGAGRQSGERRTRLQSDRLVERRLGPVGPRDGRGRSGRKALLTAVLGAVLSMPAYVLASEDRLVEELVVSASRIGPVDQHVEVLDEEELAAAAHVVDALRLLPGLALATSGNRSALTQGRLRGAEANHLLVLLDGVAVNDPAAGSEFDFGILDLTAMRRVELLAGPQSAVWGSDALAGVLYVDTTPRESRRQLSLGLGSRNAVDGDAQWAAVGERGYAAIDVGWLASDGTNAALQGDEDDGFANRTVHARGARGLGRWELSSSFRWTDARLDFDPSPAPGFVPIDGDRTTRNLASLLQANMRFLGWRRVAPSLTVSSLRTEALNMADGALANVYAGRRDSATLAVNALLDRQRFNFTVEAEAEAFEQRGTASVFGDPNQNQRTATASVAGEYQLDFTAAALSASLRRDFNDAFAHAFAYRIGATTLGNPRWFASVGRGVKNPTFTERFGYTPDTFIGNPELQPETATGFEFGLKWTWPGGSLAAVAFDNTLRGEIDGFAFDPERGGFTARNRTGDSKRRGAELVLDATLKRLQVHASYAFVAATDGNGEREFRRPRHLANVSLRTPLTKRLSTGLAVTHASASLDGDYSTFPARRARLSGHRLLRLDASFRAAPGWRLRVFVDNMLDTDYATVFGYRNPGRAAMARIERVF